MRSSPLRAHLGLIAVATIWGTNFTALKVGMRALGPLPLSAFRFSLASAALWIVLRRLERQSPLPRRTLLALVGLGILGNTVYQTAFMTGLSLTSASNSAMIVAALPVLVALLGSTLRLEPAGPSTWISVVLGTAGVGLVVSAQGVSFSGSSVQGDLLVLLATLCWAGYTLGVRRAGAGIDPLQVTAITTLAGTPGLLAVGFPGLLRADWGAIDAVGWGAIAYSAFLSILVAYWLYNDGVQVLGSSRAALYNCLTPLVAMLVAWLALGERLTGRQLAGVMLVIAGVLVSAVAGARLRPAPATAGPRPALRRDSDSEASFPPWEA